MLKLHASKFGLYVSMILFSWALISCNQVNKNDSAETTTEDQELSNENNDPMSNSDIIKQWGTSTVNGDWDTFDALTADNFELIGPGPEPLGKDAYWGWIKSVVAANTDHDNNLALSAESENVYKGSVQMEGVHSNDWDLSFMGLGVIPATGKTWKNPKENLTVTIENGKVVQCDVEVPEDGGIKGILTQLGVDMSQPE